MDIKQPLEFFGENVKRIVTPEKAIIYEMRNDTGEGVITNYSIFPGIELFYNDFHMKDGGNENKHPRSDVLEINHCREGRFECELQNGDCKYLGAGDLSINLLTNQSVATLFPLAHYHGISLTIHLPEAEKTLRKISDVFGGLAINVSNIRDRMCSGNDCLIMRGQEPIQHLFDELYTLPEESSMDFCRIKVLELLLKLSSTSTDEFYKERRYFLKTQVETIKAIHDYLIEHLDKPLTLEQLSKTFDIPLTSMKECFKGVYGVPIYTYIKAYRMQTAARLLLETKESITEIALRVGYANPSNFSDAFKKEMGMLPSDYRKLPSK